MPATPDISMNPSNTDTLAVTDFGLRDYREIYALQKTLVEKRYRDEIPDTVLIGEHPPVITLGRGTKPANLLNPAIDVIEIERGGDVTYHGPGQLIAYPILKLEGQNRDLHRYLRQLEEVLIQTLAGLDPENPIKVFRQEGLTGVWVKDKTEMNRKIASIGVAVSRWVTYHGIALNVSTDLGAFGQINPCGLTSDVMITLAELLNHPVGMPAVKQSFLNAFRQTI